MTRWASRHVGEYTLEDLDARIWSICTNDAPSSVIDVACGENQLASELATKTPISIVVGNDVSWRQIELIRKRAEIARTGGGVLLFTNHDATKMPFPAKTFDRAICKNVLHHMPSTEAIRALLNECTRIARRAIVVEVMDPAYENAWGRLRHRYYLDFLHDAAVHFLSTEEFNAITDVPSRSARFDIGTVRGVYQFAIFGNGV